MKILLSFYEFYLGRRNNCCVNPVNPAEEDTENVCLRTPCKKCVQEKCIKILCKKNLDFRLSKSSFLIFFHAYDKIRMNYLLIL